MGESVFEFLFKYRPVLFQRGDLTLSAPWPWLVVAIVIVALAVPSIMLYRSVRGKSTPRDRWILSGLRMAAFALLLFSLFRPVLVLSTVVPQRNFVGVLLDDSRSMRIEDVDGAPRLDFVRQHFGAGVDEDNLMSALSDKFIVRLFRFSSDVRRVDSVEAMGFSGGKTDLAAALDHARQELASVPLAGLVVVTDGADNAQASIDEPLLALQASAVPVHTIGLGRESFARDIELTRVQTPRTVLNGTSLVVDLTVSHRGYRGQTVSLLVEDDGRIVNSQEVELGEDGEAVAVRVHFTVTEVGPRLFSFRVPEQPGEIVAQNNKQEALIVVQDRREKILYFEGEPRFEIRFLKSAIKDDKNIRLVTMVRTAENKFFRSGIETEDELFSGFPKTREELFSYRALVLGSIEASYFTHDQLRMIAEFVSQRGGGLLVMGGRRALAEGGYAGTPLEDVLPVVFESEVASSDFISEVVVEPTPAGAIHPATQVAESEEASAERWKAMPAVTVVNPIYQVKPGATTLLRGRGSGLSDPQVVLASQRFGRGKVLALPIQDSWLWQMHHDVPIDDQTHERFWGQLLRWLVAYVPDRVTVNTPSDQAELMELVTTMAQVEDETYLRVNNTDVSARVTSPTGITTEIEMDWTVDRDGEYEAAFTPDEEGLYTIEVESRGNDEATETSVGYLQAGDLAREYYDAQLRASLLQRIAEETGGGYYTPESVDALAQDITYTESGTTVIEERDLWDMPIILLLVLGLVCSEWGYRRIRGLV